MSLFVLQQNEQMNREWSQFLDDVTAWQIEQFQQKYSSDDDTCDVEDEDSY